MLLCQITDTHVKAQRKLAYGVVDTASFLERCVAHVLRLPQRPDVVIMTGDLVDYGRADEPCFRCGTPIEKTRAGGRGTWYCPGCQR